MTRRSIELPQATFDFHQSLPGTTRLLFLGGRAPSDVWMKKMIHLQTNSSIVAVDRGIKTCRRLGLAPDILIGDADSAGGEDWAWGERQAKRVKRHPVLKDFTDTQLALKCMNGGNAVLLLTGGFGGRFDHAYSTIFSAAQTKDACLLADERETIAYVRAGEMLTLHCNDRPKAISLLPMTSEVQGVTATGLYWPLHDALLAQSLPNAVSNVLEEDANDCTVSVRLGCLAVYACWVNR